MRAARSGIGIVLAGAALRVCGALAAKWVFERRYGDSADAHDYHAAAVEIAPRLRSGEFAQALTLARNYPWSTNYKLPVGTSFIRLFNGGVYAAAGPSKPTSYVTFSSIGFCGLLCFRRAFTLAVPDGDQRGYMRLLFLHPSVLFWNCTVGKEAWTTLGLGLGTLGVARTLTGAPARGLALAAAGGAVTTLVRPQIPLYLGFGSGFALEERREATPGGSWFEPPKLSAPRNLPRVAASVLFRPYPGEVRNPLAQVASAESATLILFTLVRLPRTLRSLRSLRPFTGFVLTALLGSIGMLARLSNAGLLVRERAPMMPLYLMLLCAAPPCEDAAG